MSEIKAPHGHGPVRARLPASSRGGRGEGLSGACQEGPIPFRRAEQLLKSPSPCAITSGGEDLNIRNVVGGGGDTVIQTVARAT